MLASSYGNETQDYLKTLSECQINTRMKLEDIATNIEFDYELRVFHPNYKPFEAEQEVRERFLKLPMEAQKKQISKHLRSFLYGAYYNGSIAARSSLTPSEPTDSQTLKNESIIGIDVELFQNLNDNNMGSGYFDPGWLIERWEPDGWLALRRGEMVLHVNPELHLEEDYQQLKIGEVVAVKMPKNCLQEGFYVAIGEAGPAHSASLDEDQTTVRLYFNVASTGATILMQALTEQLNYSKTPFAFKVPYNYSSYDRYDTGVLYIQKQNYPEVFPVLQEVYRKNSSYFCNEVPLFSKQLSPGLGLAEEPNRKFELYESFGMNRCQIVAMSLLEAKQKNLNAPEVKLALIIQRLSQFKVDLAFPYLNGDSEDIYMSLDV